MWLWLMNRGQWPMEESSGASTEILQFLFEYLTCDRFPFLTRALVI